MLTMRPPPRSIMSGAQARQHMYTPRTFTSNTCHHSSTPGSASPGPEMPALFTSRSTAPTSPHQRATSSRFETSPTSARPPISSATDCTSPAVRPVTMTSMPARASSRAMFAPMPRPPPVTSAVPRRSDSICDLLQGLGVLESGQVARILAERTRTDGAPHDLRRARLRERGHPHDAVRLERLPQRIRNSGGDERVVALRAVRHAEDPRHLALHRVRDADGSGLGDDAAADRGGLELGGTDALAGDVERVVAASVQEPVAVVVHRRPVAVCPDAGEAPPVRVEVALLVAPDASRHPRPRPLAHELADLAANRVPGRVEDVHVF